MIESDLKSRFTKRLLEKFPDALIIPGNPNYIQGIPDLFVMHNQFWGALEGKQLATSKRQPNQGYYIDLCRRMSFGEFLNYSNEEEIFDEICGRMAKSPPHRRPPFVT